MLFSCLCFSSVYMASADEGSDIFNSLANIYDGKLYYLERVQNVFEKYSMYKDKDLDVKLDGAVVEYGGDVILDYGAVRPALWINLE